MKKLNKRIMYGVGALSTVIAPVVTVISCSADDGDKSVDVSKFKWPTSLTADNFKGKQNTGWVDGSTIAGFPSEGALLQWSVGSAEGGSFGTAQTLVNGDTIKLRIEAKEGYSLSGTVADSGPFTVIGLEDTVDVTSFSWPDAKGIAAAAMGNSGEGYISTDKIPNWPSAGVTLTWAVGQGSTQFSSDHNLKVGDQVTLKMNLDKNWKWKGNAPGDSGLSDPLVLQKIADTTNFKWPTTIEKTFLTGPDTKASLDKNKIPGWPSPIEAANLQWSIKPPGQEDFSAFGTSATLANNDTVKLRIVATDGYKLSKEIQDSDPLVISGLDTEVNTDNFAWPSTGSSFDMSKDGPAAKDGEGKITLGLIKKFLTVENPPTWESKQVDIKWEIKKPGEANFGPIGVSPLTNGYEVRITISPAEGNYFTKEIEQSPPYTIEGLRNVIDNSKFQWPTSVTADDFKYGSPFGKVIFDKFPDWPANAFLNWKIEGSQTYDSPNLSQGDKILFQMVPGVGYELKDNTAAKVTPQTVYTVPDIKLSVDFGTFVPKDGPDLVAEGASGTGWIDPTKWAQQASGWPQEHVSIQWARKTGQTFGPYDNAQNLTTGEEIKIKLVFDPGYVSNSDTYNASWVSDIYTIIFQP